MKTDALRIGPSSGRITVSGNSFSSSYIGDGKDRRQPDDRQAAGLILAKTSGVNVSSNVFSGVGPKALGLDGESSRILFADNLLIGVQSDHENLRESLTSDNLVE
jgi:hypothetical protein